MKYLLLVLLSLGCSKQDTKENIEKRRAREAIRQKESVNIVEYDDAKCFVYNYKSISCIPKRKD